MRAWLWRRVLDLAIAVAAVLALYTLIILIGLMVVWLAGPAHAHDIWTQAREFNRSSGFPCCGGDPEVGDCEGLTDDQVWEQPDGSVYIYSNRYHARIHIPASRIMVDLPRDVTTGQALDPLVRFTAHYCGKPRTALLPPEPDDDDPNFHLFCFFRNGGGS